jgi:hypothetical protein
MPALPLDEAGKYVAAAYLVFLALILTYVAIMAAKLARIDRELEELADVAEAQAVSNPSGADAGADQNARGEAEGNMFERVPEDERARNQPQRTSGTGAAGSERERSSREEIGLREPRG